MTAPAATPAERAQRGAGGASAERGASAASALGNSALPPSAAGDEAGRQRRNEAWKLRRRLWEISSLPRVRACGRVPRGESGGAVLRVGGGRGPGRAGFAGLVSCGSPWACPCCARKIGARRAEEIREVIAAVDAQGGGCGLITFTLRHHKGHGLEASWGALRYAWGRVTSGRAWVRDRERFGIEGFICAVEVTYSDEHGHHPHLHVVTCHDTPVSQELLAELGGRLFARFERALGKRGFTALEFSGGLDVQAVTADSSGRLGVYLQKLALEVSGGTTKTARRRGSRTMWQVLADGASTGLADDLEAWFAYERASHTRKQVTFSRGLRRRFRLAEQASDEEVAEEDAGGDDALILPAETWRVVRDHAEQLLTAAEVDGVPGAMAWLTARRLAWSKPDTHPLGKPVPRGTGS